MKRRIWTSCAAILLVAALCARTAVESHAASTKPEDVPTRENTLELFRQYDADAYHILKTELDSGYDFFLFFGPNDSILSGIGRAVHETCHAYTFEQYNDGKPGHGERIYIGDGKGYDIDYSIVYKDSGFIKTEEMSKDIPLELRTVNYDKYVAPGRSEDANTKGVFGLLNEWAANCWELKAMNSLTQFLLDADVGETNRDTYSINVRAMEWSTYSADVQMKRITYTEFKYWTLRYMTYIRSANPSLYQAILDNGNYCMAYRDVEERFAAEIERTREIINTNNAYLRAQGYEVGWPWLGIGSLLSTKNDNTSDMWDPRDYGTLLLELEKPEYVEMDSILKAAADKAEQPSEPSAPTTPSTPAGPSAPVPEKVMLSPQKLAVDGREIDCEKYNIDGSNYFKLRDLAQLLSGTGSQFEVSYDPAASAVTITTGAAYTPAGGELATGVDNSSTAQPSAQSILIDGTNHGELTVYNIGGSNFFQLRELGDLLGFEVGYDLATNTATVSSR